jgi:hypothetical protein
MKHFRDTMDKAKNETDPGIKAIVARNMSRWQEAYDKHKEGMDEVTAGIRTCQDWLAGR